MFRYLTAIRNTISLDKHNFNNMTQCYTTQRISLSAQYLHALHRSPKHTCKTLHQTHVKNYFNFSCVVIWFFSVVEIPDHVYLRHLSTEYRSILSADMSTDIRPIYRPTLGRYVGRDSVDISADCRSTRMSGDTL